MLLNNLASNADTGSLAKQLGGQSLGMGKAGMSDVSGKMGDDTNTGVEGGADFAALLASVLSPSKPIDPMVMHLKLNGNSLHTAATNMATDVIKGASEFSEGLSTALTDAGIDISQLASKVQQIPLTTKPVLPKSAAEAQAAEAAPIKQAMALDKQLLPQSTKHSGLDMDSPMAGALTEPPSKQSLTPELSPKQSLPAGLQQLESIIKSATQGLYANKDGMTTNQAPAELTALPTDGKTEVHVLETTHGPQANKLPALKSTIDSQTFLAQLAAQGQAKTESPSSTIEKLTTEPTKPFAQISDALKSLDLSRPLDLHNLQAKTEPIRPNLSKPENLAPPIQAADITQQLSRAMVAKPEMAIASQTLHSTQLAHLGPGGAMKPSTKNSLGQEMKTPSGEGLDELDTTDMLPSTVVDGETPAKAASPLMSSQGMDVPMEPQGNDGASLMPQSISIEALPSAGLKPLTAGSSGNPMPTLDVSGSDIVQTLGNNVTQAVQSHKPAVTLQLTPENLGNLRIHLSTGADDMVSARLVVSHPEALQKLDSTIQELRQNLESKGIQVDQLRVTLAGEAFSTVASQQMGHGNQSKHDHQQEHSRFGHQGGFDMSPNDNSQSNQHFGQNIHEAFQGMRQDLQQQSSWQHLNHSENGRHTSKAMTTASEQSNQDTASAVSSLMNPSGTMSLLA